MLTVYIRVDCRPCTGRDGLHDGVQSARFGTSQREALNAALASGRTQQPEALGIHADRPRGEVA